MAEKRDERTPTGVGPGVTGASGDFIEGTGGDQGIGGTGEKTPKNAAGQRPDERHAPPPQELENARPEPSDKQEPLAAGDVQADVPGGTRNVGPANDLDTSGQRARETDETGRVDR